MKTIKPEEGIEGTGEHDVTTLIQMVREGLWGSDIWAERLMIKMKHP